ncbi:MAG: putative membrane protein [Planctomycetota bacterium]|jgi:uncharacterized membrane protein
MEFSPVDFSGTGGGAMMFLLGLFSTAVGLFWMVVAWRAMRAHERLAAATATLASKRESKVSSNS